MQVKNKIRIDLLKRTLPLEVDAVQGDAYSRYVEISLYSGFAAWAIPQDAVAAVRYRKPDGTRGYYDTMPDGTVAWHIQENTVTIQLAPQMLTVRGDVLAQIEIIQGVSVLTTFSLKIHVEENPAAGFVRSEDYKNWLQWMEQRAADYIQDGIDSGIFQGPPGPCGPGAELISSVVTYQTGDSGTIIPSGVWSESIPVVAQGKYLWTREVTQFNTGDPITKYSVARFGIDGAGLVSSVCNVSPDENGNVLLTAEDVDALPTAGGTMTGPVNMNGQKLSGLNTPAEDTEAATKGYTLGLVKKAAPRNLLDNSDFSNPVNQRGLTIYTTNGYTIDRWGIWSPNGLATLTVGPDGITFSPGEEDGTLTQRIQKGILNRNKTYTLAYKRADGSIDITILGPGGHSSLIAFDFNDTCDLVTLASATETISWAALYEGEYTAETLPEYQPKGYGAELLECMRYYHRFERLRIKANGPGNYPLFFGVPMRIVPTISFEVEYANEITNYIMTDWNTQSCTICITEESSMKDTIFHNIELNAEL